MIDLNVSAPGDDRASRARDDRFLNKAELGRILREYRRRAPATAIGSRTPATSWAPRSSRMTVSLPRLPAAKHGVRSTTATGTHRMTPRAHGSRSGLRPIPCGSSRSRRQSYRTLPGVQSRWNRILRS